MNFNFILNNINYIGSAVLFITGLFTVINNGNLIKKIIGINIMETSVCLLFLTIGYVEGANIPILSINETLEHQLYVNPLPSALILTGIVISVSITSYGLGLVIKIYDTYGTIDLNEISLIERQQSDEQ